MSVAMVKVLFIAYYFPPVGGAGVQRAQKFVQYLPDEGFLPIVVTGPVADEGRWTPQDASLLEAIPSNVEIHKTRGPVPEDVGKLRRRLKTFFASPSAFEEWWVRSATEVGCNVAGDARLIFATMPPYESALAASVLSQRLGIPWVADFRDPWAIDEIQVYPTWLHRNVGRAKMERLLSGASLIIMNTPQATSALKLAFPKLCQKEILTITNGFDREDFSTLVPARTDSKFRIVHAGYFLTNTGLELRKRGLYQLMGGVDPGVDILTRSPTTFLEAMSRWCSERPEIRREVEILFAGKTSGADRSVAESSPVSDLIRFTGYLPHADSLRLVRTADLLFLPMHNIPSGRRATTAPSKTYEYIASGRPILGAVPDGDARDYLNECGTGHTCRPDDVVGMVEILDKVYSKWKAKTPTERPNGEFVSRFDRKRLTSVLAKALHSVPSTPIAFGHL
jgi:glycosyltransferase involved in cell wall biosynthesis